MSLRRSIKKQKIDADEGKFIENRHRRRSTNVSTTTSKDDDAETRNKYFQFLKIAMPHIGISLFLFGFLIAGAAAFRALEHQKDSEYLDTKLAKIREIYTQIAEEIYENRELCNSATKTQTWKVQLYQSLSQLSSRIENRPFELHPDGQQPTDELFPPRWNTLSSILYALSILTTTGYTYVFPMTSIGQLFAVVYGLIGIPLMVLTAVDIGRFLSDSVLFAYNQSALVFHSIANLFSCSRHRSAIFDSTTTTRLIDVVEVEIVDGNNSGSSKRCSGHKNKPTEAVNTRRLPLWVNASILLLFCMLGGLAYIICGGSQKTFLEVFFTTFNLVANLTMSEMPTDINTVFTVFYIVFFVTFGLAVLSMCADLAASELKWLFMKIHYFGRKINWKRKAARSKEMQVEVKELLKIIEAIRHKYPNKGKITSYDILQFIHEMNMPDDLSLSRRCYDTNAFIPQIFEGLKYADETDQDESFMQHRSISRLSSGNPIGINNNPVYL